MSLYRPAGQNLPFPCPIPELEPFVAGGAVGKSPTVHSFSFQGRGIPELVSSTRGWVANAERVVDVYSFDNGFLLKVEGCGEYYVTLPGEAIGKLGLQPDSLNQLDRDVLLGSVIILALALRGIWSLHASAVMHSEKEIAFLGESGTGKSTLAAYLSRQTNWQLVADDILPVTYHQNGLTAHPHFPQLKLSPDAQPGANLPEQLSLDVICELLPVGVEAMPEIQLLSQQQAVRVFLSHTAGTRLFDEKLLKAHLAFCAQLAEVVPVYQLKYPHSQDALPSVKKLLENLC